MNFEEFQIKCNAGNCLRRTIISRQCLKVYKQEKCFKKYSEKYLREEVIDERWFEVVKQIKKRDNNECQLWKILLDSEKRFILDNYIKDYRMLKKCLDPCHIIPRSRDKSLYYELSNIVLCCRYFHTLLDEWKDPVDRKHITDEKRILWFRSALEGIRLI